MPRKRVSLGLKLAVRKLVAGFTCFIVRKMGGNNVSWKFMTVKNRGFRDRCQSKSLIKEHLDCSLGLVLTRHAPRLLGPCCPAVLKSNLPVSQPLLPSLLLWMQGLHAACASLVVNDLRGASGPILAVGGGGLNLMEIEGGGVGGVALCPKWVHVKESRNERRNMVFVISALTVTDPMIQTECG